MAYSRLEDIIANRLRCETCDDADVSVMTVARHDGAPIDVAGIHGTNIAVCIGCFHRLFASDEYRLTVTFFPVESFWARRIGSFDPVGGGMCDTSGRFHAVAVNLKTEEVTCEDGNGTPSLRLAIDIYRLYDPISAGAFYHAGSRQSNGV